MRRPLLWTGGLVIAALGLGLIWIAATGLSARHNANRMRSQISTLKTDLEQGNDSAAAALVRQMQGEAGAAHARTSGPAWWVAAKLPTVGRPAKTARGGAVILDDLANYALPAALTAGESLNPHKLRTGPNGLDLGRLSDAATSLGRARDATAAALASAQALPSSTWLGAADNSRTLLIKDLNTLHRGLADLSAASTLLPEPLGASGTRRYFLAFQTDAESRGLGGLPGAYAILQARHGQLSFLRFGSDVDLGSAKANVNLGADYRRQYSDAFGPEANFVNSDASPHFPYAARIWMSMWENTYHQHLDGAIATDPTALSYLLGATGDVTLADGTVLNQANAVSFFENRIYSKFAASDTIRKRYQVAAAQAIADNVLHQPSGDLLKTATALRRAADEGRLLVYTRDPNVETSLQHDPVAGILPETSQPFFGVIVNNSGGDKLDYYLDRTVTYHRATCAAGPATVTVILHNGAPTRGLAPTVVGVEAQSHSHQPGFSDLLVSVYSTQHSSVSGVTVDGRTGFYDAERERGHPVAITAVGIPPGQSRTLVFRVREPAATGPVEAWRQPLVRPLRQTISAPQCVGSPATRG
jgi:hypothetical protein